MRRWQVVPQFPPGQPTAVDRRVRRGGYRGRGMQRSTTRGRGRDGRGRLPARCRKQDVHTMITVDWDIFDNGRSAIVTEPELCIYVFTEKTHFYTLAAVVNLRWKAKGCSERNSVRKSQVSCHVCVRARVALRCVAQPRRCKLLPGWNHNHRRNIPFLGCLVIITQHTYINTDLSYDSFLH